jgi:hypothetical protein
MCHFVWSRDLKDEAALTRIGLFRRKKKWIYLCNDWKTWRFQDNKSTQQKQIKADKKRAQNVYILHDYDGWKQVRIQGGCNLPKNQNLKKRGFIQNDIKPFTWFACQPKSGT